MHISIELKANYLRLIKLLNKILDYLLPYNACHHEGLPFSFATVENKKKTHVFKV